MLAFLRGTIRTVLPDAIVVECHDVGYRVAVPAPLREWCSVGAPVELHTHEVVREDRRELFGMQTSEELTLFELLLTVSGVGPKIALGILSLGDPREIRHAIGREDVAYLSKVVGIGRKTAERVVVELKGKMRDELPPTMGGASARTDGDVVDALVQLGYTLHEVREVIRKLPMTTATTEEKLKVALRELGRR